MKRSIFIIAVLVASSAVFAALTKGPYLQNVQKHQIIIGWETTDAAPGTLYWGDSADNLNNQAASMPVEFSYRGGVLYNHWGTLAGLECKKTYYYRIEGLGYSSDVYWFTTAPKNTEPFRFVVYGDSRGGSIASPNQAHEMVADAILSEQPNFYLNTGDLVSDGENLDDWDYFCYAEKELLATSTLYPVFGNHEEGQNSETGISGEENFLRLFEYYGPSGGASWYSFDFANVHIIVLNIEKYLSLALPGAEQRVWLESDLVAATQNPYTNFIFALYHEPSFTWKKGRTPNIIAKTVLDPLFQSFGVKLIFAGHDHFYAHAFFNDMDHVTTGGGGAPLYDFVDNPEGRPGYRAHEKVYHYCLIEVSGQEAKVTAIRAQDGSIIETFSVYSPYPVVPEPDDDSADDDDSDDDTSGDDEEGEEAGCGC